MGLALRNQQVSRDATKPASRNGSEVSKAVGPSRAEAAKVARLAKEAVRNPSGWVDVTDMTVEQRLAHYRKLMRG
ncbi:hypothetical protein [Roseomonas mucosa]|uniref:hypothetical protein n=1 Tax=Roseomonas mucosa TaxID=207340 RepID=UPI001DE08D57|nr:hypothetical protein [Roseomonas mucosa]MBS5905186.1 hypothetical protein [Acetobacteraceae bacterium]MDT8312681.1 hypothetical protein [Roseomonas mucosa]MDT8351231.1 hypothetical protein [Roseomonas mucosa]MDT8360166.1 hypothetical protein [Roseomonas mucosa]UZO92340.1 Hypothetical protein RMP42_05940 [Roseomonas mucosa]